MGVTVYNTKIEVPVLGFDPSKWTVSVTKYAKSKRNGKLKQYSAKAELYLYDKEKMAYILGVGSLDYANFNIERDLRTHNDLHVDIDFDRLLPHQRDILDFMFSRKRGLVVFPTGSGKTEIFPAYSKAVLDSIPDSSVLVLVPTKPILAEVLNRCEKWDLKAKAVYDIDGSERGIVVVGLPKSILEEDRLTLLKNMNVKAILNDECHKGHTLWRKVFFSLHSAEYLFGFSASLDPEEKKLLDYDYKNALVRTVFGKDVISATPTELAQKYEYYLNVPCLVNLVIPYVRRRNLRSLDWNEIKRTFIYDERRIRIIVETVKLLHDYKYKLICFVNDTDLGITIAKRLDIPVLLWTSKRVVSNFYSIDGRPDVNTVKQYVQSGKISCIIATDVAQAGIDIPELDAVMLVCGKSFFMNTQRVGRVMRISSRMPIVINFMDKGTPLVKQSRHRIQVLKENPGVVGEIEVYGLKGLRKILPRLSKMTYEDVKLLLGGVNHD